jgi:hypothetical protein
MISELDKNGEMLLPIATGQFALNLPLDATYQAVI